MKGQRYGLFTTVATGVTVAGPMPGVTEVVFVEETVVAEFEQTARKHGLKVEEIDRFKTFYSRRAWLRFARESARWPEWKQALCERSLESLKTEIRYYRVSLNLAQP